MFQEGNENEDVYDIKYRPKVIKKLISDTNDIADEKEIYVNKAHTLMIYPKNKLANHILKKYTRYKRLDNDSFTSSGRWNLPQAVKYGIESDEYDGDKNLWGNQFNSIYGSRYLREFCILTESLNDKTMKISDGDDVPIYFESESFRMVLANKIRMTDV